MKMMLLSTFYRLENRLKMESRVQGHIASKQQNQDINPGVPRPKTYALPCTVKRFIKRFKMKTATESYQE